MRYVLYFVYIVCMYLKIKKKKKKKKGDNYVDKISKIVCIDERKRADNV